MTKKPQQRPYRAVAAEAISDPYIWKTLRQGQSSANLVTRIRSGAVPDFLPEPPGYFEARSFRQPGGKYGIEVRFIPKAEPVSNLEQVFTEALDKAWSEIRPALIRRLIQDYKRETQALGND